MDTPMEAPDTQSTELFNPETNQAAQFDRAANKWVNLGDVNSLSPDIKYAKVVPSPDGKQKAGYNKFTKQWEVIPEDDWIDSMSLPSSVERGVRQASLIDDYAGLSSGLKSKEDVAKEVARTNTKINQEPMTPSQARGVKEIEGSKTFSDFAENIVKNPAAVGSILGESIGSMSGAGIAALGLGGIGRIAKVSPWAMRALSAGAFGLGSGATEATSTFLSGLQDEGIDVSKEDEVKRALSDPKLMERLNTRAVLRGIPIGAFDAITEGLAGKALEGAVGASKGAPKKAATPAKTSSKDVGLTPTRALKGALEETALQGAGGAAGEATAQEVTDGKITNPVDVGLEAVMEGITGVPQGVMTSILTRTPTMNDLKMPAFSKNQNLNKDGSDIGKAEEAFKKVETAKTERRKVKKQAVEPIVDSDSVKDLTAFSPLTDNINPSEVPVINKVKKASSKKAKVVKKTINNSMKKVITTSKDIKVPPIVSYQRESAIPSGRESAIPSGQASVTYADKANFTAEKNNDVTRFKDDVGGYGSGRSEGDVFKIIEMSSVPFDKKFKPEEGQFKRRGFLTNIISSVKDLGHKTITVNLQSQDTRQALKALVKKGVLINPRDMAGISIDEHPTTFDINPNYNFNNINLQEPLSNTGNAQYDLAVENLRGVDLKDASPELANLMKNIRDDIKRMFGDKLSVAFYSSLNEIRNDSISNPVRGAQMLNNIYISMKISDDSTSTSLDPYETGMHEAFHFAQDNLLSEQDKAILNSQEQRIRNYVRDNLGLSLDDYLKLYDTTEGPKELQAVAFGIWASNKLRDSTYKGNHITPFIERVFNKILDFLKAIGKRLKGKTFEDLFEDIHRGRLVSDVLQEGLNNNSGIRWQKMLEQIEEKHQANLDVKSRETVKDLKGAIEEDTSRLGTLGLYGRTLGTMTYLASKSRVMAILFNTEKLRQEISSTYFTKHDNILDHGGYHALPNSSKEYLHNVMNLFRKYKDKGRMDNEGRIVNRDGKVVISDPELAKKYLVLQEYYATVRDDIIATLKGIIAKAHGFKDLNFTKQDVKQAIANTTDLAKKKLYQNILETLSAFEKLGNVDYCPRQRFGEFGIVVKDRETNETVYFSGIERGGPFDTINKYFNKYQMEEVFSEIKDKYSDTKKYKVIGHGGEIRKLNSASDLNPFTLTHNNIINSVDASAVSFDLLFSMMQSKGANADVLSEIQNTLIEKLYNQGFAKHLLSSDNIEGYSTDWLRVQHAYGTGVAHYIGNLHVRDKMQAIKQVVGTKGKPGSGAFKDAGLRDAAQGYVEYMESPQQDFMALRNFNFLWTMGGNLSTSALQVMTLPTTTLANITRFNGNIFSNMATIGKWFWLANRYAKESVSKKEGAFALNFNNVVDLFKKDKVIDAKGLALIKWAGERGLTGGKYVEEYAGKRAYETRSVSGKVRDSLAVASNMLGAPISYMEQVTRFATVMASYEQLSKIPNIQAKIESTFASDQRFQEQVKSSPELDLTQHAALFMMDESHAVFGKIGRAPVMRGLGGSLFFPFMTYPHNLIESMYRMLGQGKEGKRAFVTLVGSLFLFSGLIGLPGAELLKELYEAAYKATNGEEIDLDLAIRDSIYKHTGSTKLGKFITQGIFRSNGNMDIAKRIGVQVPGQDLLLEILGIRGEASDVLGVQGSLITQLANFWQNYNTDASLSSTIASISPTAIANIFKAVDYANEGVYTTKNKQLIAPEDVSARSIILRGMGITSDQVASHREENFFSKILENKYTPFLDKHREIAKKHLTRYYRALNNNDTETATKEFALYNESLTRVREEAIDKGIPISMGAFQRSVQKDAVQRVKPSQVFLKNLNKTGKKEAATLQEILGTSSD